MNFSCVLFIHTLAEEVNKPAQWLKLDLRHVHIWRSANKQVPSPADMDLMRVALDQELRLYEALQQQMLVRSEG